MIHKHELSTAISDLRQALEHVEHYSSKPEVFCLKQLLVNPLAYLLTESIIRKKETGSAGLQHTTEQSAPPPLSVDLCSHGKVRGTICVDCRGGVA